MTRAQCLNAYHLAYSKRMRRAAMLRLKRRSMSPEEFTMQARRLRQVGLREKPAA
jgi:hypothetical protein